MLIAGLLYCTTVTLLLVRLPVSPRASVAVTVKETEVVSAGVVPSYLPVLLL